MWGWGCSVWVLVLSSTFLTGQTPVGLVAQFPSSLQWAQPTVCRIRKLKTPKPATRHQVGTILLPGKAPGYKVSSLTPVQPRLKLRPHWAWACPLSPAVLKVPKGKDWLL